MLKRLKYFIFSPLLVFLVCFDSLGQTYNMGNGTINTCSGTFYDPGGGGNYGNGANFTQTFCSNNGQPIYLQFSQFQTEGSFDFVYIYNGPTTASPLIGTYAGSTSPGLVVASGTCLTIVFTSDGSVTYSGWVATIGCGTPPPPPPAPPGDACNTGIPFCTGTSYNFPAGVNQPPAPTGPNYGCLFSQPNPVWYFLQIQNPGNIDITLSNTNNVDVDFILWGPFTSPYGPCLTGLTAANTVDCSYSIAATEFVNITNAQTGQYYILLMTNFSNSNTNFTFSQTGGGGTTNCNILCNITNMTGTPGACNSTTGTFNLTGTISTYAPPNSGTLNISSSCGGSVTINPPFTTSTNYTLTNIPATGTNCVVTAQYSADPLCTYTLNVTSPAPCNTCAVTASASPATLCSGASSTLSATTVTGATAYNWTGPGGFTASGQTASVTPTASGTYTVTVTKSGGVTCTATVTVTVNPRPVITLTPTAATCGLSNGSISTVVSGGTSFTYAWTPSGGSVQSPTGLAPGTYSVTVTNNFGCTSTASVTVPNSGSVTSTFTNSANQCLTGNSFTFTNTGSSGVGITQSWSFSPSAGAPASATTVNVGPVSFTAAGTYTVTHTVTQGTCTSTSTSVVTIFPQPAVPVATAVNPTCGNSNGSFTISSPVGAGISYSVNGGALQTGTTFSALAAGTYTITVTNGNGCTSTGTVNLVNQPGPTAVVLTPTASTCGNANGSFTIGAVTGGTAPYVYSFNGGAFGSTTSFTGLSAGTYTIVVRDNNNCTFTQTVVITNTPGPTAQAVTSVNSTCGNSNGVVNIGATTGGTAPYVYSFNGGAFTSTTSYTGLAAGTYSVTVRDNNGCTFTTTIAVVNTPGPTAVVLTGVNATCGNSNGSFTIGAVTGGTAPYTYSVNGGAFTSTTSYTGQAVGIYTVTVRDNNGCTTTGTVTINNIPGPTAVVLTPVATTCGQSNGSVSIGAVTGGTAPYVYSFNGGAFSATTSYTGLAAGTYTVIVRDNNNCTFTQTIGVSNTGGPTAMVTSSTASACTPNTGTVTLGAVTGGIAPYTYSFNGSAFTSTTTYTGLAPGTYNVTVRDNNGCQFSTSVVVGSSPLPTALALTSVNSTCGNSNGVVNIGATTGGTPAYVYSFNGGSFSATTSYTGLAAGTYSVIVRDNNGCTFSNTVVVNNTAGPTALAVSNTPTTCGNANGTISIGATTGGTAPYTYSLNGGGFTATTSYTGQAAGTYTVVVRDNNGCTFQTTTTISNIPGPTAQVASNTSSTCGNANGTISIGATTGGTAPYTYSLNGGAFSSTTSYTGQPAGTYTVVVRDNNGCTFQTTTTISNIPGPTAVALTATGATCGQSNGSLSVGAVTGGTAPYLYSVNGGGFTSTTSYTGQASGTYTVTVQDANGCTTTGTVVISNTGNPVPTIASQTNVSCFGGSNGSVTISVTGGVSPFTYTINTGTFNGTGVFSGLSAGSYTISIVDNVGCQASQPIIITQPTVLTSSIASQTAVSCNGGSNGSVTVSGSGGTSPYTFSLNGGAFQPSGGFTGLSAGSYTVTVKDANGCTVNQPVVIVQPTALQASSLPSNANCTSSNGTITVTASGGTPNYTYLWTGGGGTQATTVGLVAGTYTVTVTDANNCTVTSSATIGVTPGGTATMSNVNNVTCAGLNNGSLTVSMGGASTPPYTYVWTPNAGTTATVTNLSPGNYSVTVTDAFGCVATASASIIQPTALAVNVTSNNVSCNGGSDGSITATPSGGTVAYSFLWSPGAFTSNTVNNLAIGTYTVVVTDANGCQVTATRNLTQPTALAITPVVVNTNCNQANGSITVTGSGGAGGYSFSLNGGSFGAGSFTGLLAGTYTITIKDANQCTSSFPVTISDQAGPTSSITAQSNVSCNGGNNGSATVVATGGTAPYTYSWNTSPVQTTQTASNLVQGIFAVTITDANGCVTSSGVTITQPPALVLNTTSTNPICNGNTNGTATASAIGGTAPYSSSWSSSPVQTTGTATGLGAGNYVVTVSDANQCTQIGSVSLINPAVVTVSTTVQNLSCFGVCSGTATATVTNGVGTIAYSWNTPSNQTTQTATGLCAGSYTVTATDGNGCSATAQATLTQPTQLSSSINSVVNATCSGICDGSGQVNPSGGTPPYSIQWSNGSTSAVNTSLCVGSYTATVSDALGCTTQSVLNITQPPSIVLSATKTDATCFGLCDGTATANFSGGTAPYTFLWQPSLVGGFNATALCAGSHTVTLTDANGCVQTASVSISQPSQLIATTTVTGNNFCNQNNGTAQVQVTGGISPFSYLWSNGVTTAINSGIGGGVYSVDVTDGNGCVVQAVANVNDVPGPGITLTNVQDISCFGLNDGSAQATVTGGTPGYTVTWLLPNLNPNPTQNGTGLYPGNNTVQVVDAAGCITSATVNILEPTQLVSAVGGVNNVTCNFANGGSCNGNATVLSNGGTTPYSFSWNDPSLQTTATALNLCQGSYTCTITDGNGCSSSQTVNITMPPPIVIINNSVMNISCNGGSNGSVNVTPQGGTPAYTYSWSPSVGTGPVVTNLVAGVYQLTVSDQNGCVESSAYNISEPSAFVVTTSSQPSTCSSSNGKVTIVVTGATPTYTYSWNTPGGATTATVLNVPAPATYVCNVTDANGCTTTGTVSISDLPAPRIDSVVVTPITCFGFTDGTAAVYPKAGGNATLTFNWLNTQGSSVGSSQVLSGVGAGTYIVQVTDGNGCVVDTILSITQPPALTLTTSTNQTACNGQILGVYASAGGGTPAYVYTWGGAGSGLSGGGNHNVTFTNQSNSTQTQVFTVSVTDANNCPAQNGQFTVTVNPRILPIPLDTAGCNLQTIPVSATASGGDGAPYTFTWSTGASSTGTVSSINQAVGASTTTYTVTVSDGCSTPEDTVVTLTAYPNPVASFLGINLQGCSPLTVSFAGSSGQAGDADYEWFFGDGSSAFDSVLTHVYVHSGTSATVESFNVSLVVTSQFGCRDTVTNNGYVQVFAQPDAEFIPSPASQNELNPVFEFDNLSQGGTTYLWNFGEPSSQTNTSSAFSPVHTYENSGTYMVTLIVSNAQGCRDTVEHPVTVEPEFAIYVPNAFTPNANGLNDYFQAKGIGIDESKFKMFIFDRWGEMIFQTDSFDKGWDGTAKGKSEIVQQDVYIWKIEAWDLKNVKHELAGHVTLVK